MNKEFHEYLNHKLEELEFGLKQYLQQVYGDVKIEKISISKVDKIDANGKRKYGISLMIDFENGYLYIGEGDTNEL